LWWCGPEIVSLAENGRELCLIAIIRQSKRKLIKMAKKMVEVAAGWGESLGETWKLTFF